MGNPIVFENWRSPEVDENDQDLPYFKIVKAVGGVIIATEPGGSFFNNAQTLRMIAQKINQAADAVETALRTTFGDLKEGDFFTFETGEAAGSYFVVDGTGYRKVCGKSTVRSGYAFESTPVLMVKAIFTVVR